MSSLDSDYGNLLRFVHRRKRIGQEARTAPRSEPIRKSTQSQAKGQPAGSIPNLDKDDNNDAFKLAFQRHLDELPEKEQSAFRDAFYKLSPTTILQKVKDFDENHNTKSFFRKRIEPVDRFLKILDLFLQGIAMGLQSQPEISSTVVGAVRIVIDLAVKFVTFWNKLSDMLCEFGKWLNILQQLSAACKDKHNGVLQEALANVYGDLLDFCTKARSVFIGADGYPRRWVSIRVFIQVQWKPFEDHFGGIETRVNKSLNTVHLAAQADALDDQKETLKILENILKNATDRYAIEERRRFLKWVSEINPEETHDRIIETTYPGTAEWLTKRLTFQKWFTNPVSSILWCHGKAGMGKSVLASNIINYISTQYALSEDVGIAFVYCEFGDLKTQEPKQIISTFIKQLTWKKKILSEDLLGFFQGYHGEARIPNLDTWKEQFWRLAKLFQEVYIIIDGLDECQEDARKQTLKFLLDPSQGTRKNVNRAKNRNAKISLLTDDLEAGPKVIFKAIVMSRNEADISKQFQEHAATSLCIDNEDVAPDIAAFVQGEIESRIQDGELRIYNPTLKRKVIGKLIAEADGMFLWPKLQLETICKEKSQRDVEQALGNLPQDLKDTYARMLHRINVQPASLKALAYRCFRFVLYAARPLRIEELIDALAMISPVAKREDLNLYKAADILDACGDFFVVENFTSIFRPIHTSIWSFLKDNFRERDGTLVLNRTLSHEELAIACILYFQLEFPRNGPCQDPRKLYRTIQSNPFSFYASQNFDYHIAQIPEIHNNLVHFFNKLLAGPELPDEDGPTHDRADLTNRTLAAILQIRRIRNPFNQLEIEDGFDKNSYPVNAATLLYATRLRGVRWLTREARWPIPQAMPTIHSVTATGRANILIDLLKKGISVNQEDKYGIQPLYYACQHGHYALASILVANKANVNHINSKGHALYIASSRGFSAIVELLLESNAEPNLPGGYFGTAIVAACNAGRVETVRTLLSHNAVIESTPEANFSPLHEAIISGSKDVIDLLFKHGADANSSVKEKAALLVATETRKLDIVKLLIERGADVHASHPSTGTALHIAIRKSRETQGETELAETLLRAGADVHGTKNWGPVLHAAVEIGSKEMVQLLLRYKADVNEVGEGGTTAMSIAGREGLKEIGQLLIANGADLKAQGTIALEWAARKAHVEMVRLLLDNSVDVNVGHALQFAAISGAVGNILEEDIQGTGKRQKTRAEETVELLLERGSKHGAEALSFARAGGKQSIVELLEAKGFEEDLEGGTA